jgi:ribose transport system ATP-binding protein
LRIDRIVLLSYIVCSLFAALGAVMLTARISVGDPQQGVNYTLSSNPRG